MRRRGAGALPALHRPPDRGDDGGVAGVDGRAGSRSRACDRSRTSSTSRTTCCSSGASRCTRSTSTGCPGRGLVVRLADDGEKMTTLDGVERTLTAEDLLVCDAERRPQAIAGIMGGAEAEVHDGTTEILLEAAYFQPMGISRSSKRLGLRSESSARFERGIDPNGVLDRVGPRRGAAPRGRAARPSRPSRSTSTRSPISPGPHHGARPAGRGAARRRARRRRGSRTRCGRSSIEIEEPDGGDDVRRGRADVPPRPRARDRHRRGGRPAGRLQRDPAHAAAHDRASAAGSRRASASGA